MAGLPWFKVYARDMLADSRFSSWTLEERGAWMTLLCHNWHDGAIPAGLTAQARLLHVDAADMSRIWSAIGDRFSPHPTDPGLLVSPRLEEERDKADQLIAKRADAGGKGATARWQKQKRPHGKRIRLSSTGPDKGNATKMATDAKPDRQKPACQPPASSPQITEASQTEADGLAGGNTGSALLLFRSQLAERLDLPKAVAVGKDPERVVAFFESQIAAVGEECVLNDCVQMAKKSTNGTPSALSWFVGWLERLPMQKPEATA